MQGADVDGKSGLRGGRDRGARRCPVGQRLRHLRREFVELGLRLRQELVAHLQERADFARLDRAGRDEICAGAVRQSERDRADAALGRIGVPQSVRRQRAVRIE